MNRRHAMRSIVALGAAAALPRAAAGEYPDRPLRLIVPSAAGSIVDVYARRFAQQLARGLGQPVVIDNRPGASNTIGVALGANAAPDGYTLTTGTSSSLAVAPALGMPLEYDPVHSFQPLTQFVATPLALVVNAELPVRSVQDLVALAKSPPRALAYASTGNAGTNHIAAEVFRHTARIELVHVPYKGSAAGLADVIGGQVQLAFDFPATCAGMVRAGRLRALMVTSKRRVPVLPGVPTAAEAGYPGVDIVPWAGFVVPAATPRHFVERLFSEMTRTARHPEVRQPIEAEGAFAVSSSPQAFHAFIVAERARFVQIVKTAGIRLEH